MARRAGARDRERVDREADPGEAEPPRGLRDEEVGVIVSRTLGKERSAGATEQLEAPFGVERRDDAWSSGRGGRSGGSRPPRGLRPCERAASAGGDPELHATSAEVHERRVVRKRGWRVGSHDAARLL